MVSLIGSLFLIGFELPTDKVAHFGVSYTGTHMCTVGLNKGLELDKDISSAICATGMLAIGAARELSGNADPNDMLSNTLGIGLAVTVINIKW